MSVEGSMASYVVRVHSVIRDTCAIVCARPDLSAALPAMVASSGEVRLTGAFEANRGQAERDPTRNAPSNEKSGNNFQELK